MASSLGQIARQDWRASRPGSRPVRARPRSRLSSPAMADWSGGTGRVLMAMTPHFLAQPVGDLAGQLGDLDRVDPSRSGSGHVILLDHPPWPAAQHDDPVPEPGRLADVM